MQNLSSTVDASPEVLMSSCGAGIADGLHVMHCMYTVWLHLLTLHLPFPPFRTKFVWSIPAKNKKKWEEWSAIETFVFSIKVFFFKLKVDCQLFGLCLSVFDMIAQTESKRVENPEWKIQKPGPWWVWELDIFSPCVPVTRSYRTSLLALCSHQPSHTRPDLSLSQCVFLCWAHISGIRGFSWVTKQQQQQQQQCTNHKRERKSLSLLIMDAMRTKVVW